MNNLFPAYYKLRNYLHSLVLLAGMLSLLSLIGWLLAGPAGIGWFLLVGLFVFISAPRLTPHFILRLHRAQALRPKDAPRLYEIISWLAERAGMSNIPTLYYIPSSVINAFTTGLKKNTVIALSDGMLRQLDQRELTGVLAHEISHIKNNDLLVLMMADVISRMTSVMAFTGYILIWIYIPLYILTDAMVPWMLLIILVVAPTLSVLMQLALSRAHEFSADLEAARLTNDPLGLAYALEKIEHYQGGWIERMFMPSRRRHEPVLLRTHPLMVERINILKELAEKTPSSDHPFHTIEKHNCVQHPMSNHDPRRWFI